MGLRSWLRGRKTPTVVAPSTPPPPTEDDIKAALVRVQTMLTDGNAPPVIVARVQRIAKTITDTLPRLKSMGLGSMDAYSVMATATDYLPEAVGGYLRLPRDWADTRPVDGYKTALMLLVEQLELLGSTMDKILDAVSRADAQALIANGLFLQQKFGSPSTGNQLNLGTP